MAKHNYVLTRKCQVNGELMDPKGKGAFIKNLPDSLVIPCPACLRTPGKNNICWPCRGEGKVEKMRSGERVWVKCTTCDGTGINEDGLCQYCKGTKRSYPPHHYVEVDEAGDEILDESQQAEAEGKAIKKSEQETQDEQEKENLRKELTGMGKDFLPGWDLNKLRKEVTKAKKAGG